MRDVPATWCLLATIILHIGVPAPLLSQASGCDGDAFRRLDFWLGEWTVSVGGTPAGTNRIARILGGCAIEEHWISTGGQPGQSLFYYIPAADQWRQVWVTTNPLQPGGVKEKREVARGDTVIFQGELTAPSGRRYLDRTLLMRLADGRVRQLIQISTDSGATWRDTFDGLYERRPPDRR